MNTNDAVKTYAVLTEGFINGRLRAVGDPVEMTEKQAKYLLLNGQIGGKAPQAKKAQKEKGDI